jgi:hypothetical protein
VPCPDDLLLVFATIQAGKEITKRDNTLQRKMPARLNCPAQSLSAGNSSRRVLPRLAAESIPPLSTRNRPLHPCSGNFGNFLHVRAHHTSKPETTRLHNSVNQFRIRHSLPPPEVCIPQDRSTNAASVHSHMAQFRPSASTKIQRPTISERFSPATNSPFRNLPLRLGGASNQSLANRSNPLR